MVKEEENVSWRKIITRTSIFIYLGYDCVVGYHSNTSRTLDKHSRLVEELVCFGQ